MFKLETFVKPVMILFCLMCLAVFSTQSFGDDDDDNNSKPALCAHNFIKYAKQHGTVYKTKKEEKAAYDKAFEDCRGATARSCKDDQADFTKAFGELNGLCSAAGMGSSATECAKQVRSCNEAGGLQSTLDEESTLPYDIDRMSEQHNKCPSMASKDLKKINEDLKETRQEIKDLKEKIPELQKDQKEETAAAQDKVNDATEQLQEQQKQCREEQKNLQRQLKDVEKSIQDQIQQQNAQILSLNDQLGQAENDKVKAAFAYAKQKADLEDQCHLMAITKVNAKRKEILDKVATSTYNVGDMSAAISKAGVTSRKRDQQMAFQEYKWCMNDASTMRKFRLAQQAYEVAEDAYKKRTASLKAQMQQIQQQIGVLANNETARARTENAEDLRDLQVTCTQSIALAQQRLSQAQMNAMSSSVGGMLGMPGTQNQQVDALTEAKRDLELAKERERNIVQAYRMASGGSGDAESYLKVMTKAGDVSGVAFSYAAGCCSDDVISSSKGICTLAQNYLAAYGNSVTTYKSGPVDVASTPRPTASDPAPSETGGDTPGSERDTATVTLPDGSPGHPVPIPQARPAHTEPCHGNSCR